MVKKYIKYFVESHIQQFRDLLFTLNFLFNRLLEGLRLYSLSLVIPLSLTFVLLFMSVIGLVKEVSFFDSVYNLWTGYYLSYEFFEGYPVWRLHLLLVVICITASWEWDYGDDDYYDEDED